MLQGKSDNKRSQSTAIKRSTAVRGGTKRPDCKAAPDQPFVLARKTTRQATRAGAALDKRTHGNSNNTRSVSSKTVNGKAAFMNPALAASHNMVTRSTAAVAVKQSAANSKRDMAAKPSAVKASKYLQHAAAPTITAGTQLTRSTGVSRSTAGVAQRQPGIKPRWV